MSDELDSKEDYRRAKTDLMRAKTEELRAKTAALVIETQFKKKKIADLQIRSQERKTNIELMEARA
jgi:hypothetical protein